MSRSVVQILTRLLAGGLFALVLPAGLRADSAFLQFSATTNPNGNWSYGSVAGIGGAFTLYTDNTPLNFGQPPFHPAWRGTSATGNPLGWVAANTTGTTFISGGGSPVWPAGYLFLVPGGFNAMSVLRWTAPSSGQYTITGLFQGIDQVQLSTADVYILVNGVPVFTSLINTFGVPLPFNLTLTLAAGTTIDFAVGNGGNGTGHDQIGLVANVNPVPEPGTMLLVGVGLLGIARKKIRKKLIV